ncbi:MAG TPA: TetR/AcrR family transcriptional regulator [Steroidobacteraceae bacterium]|jgi:AcrR family transcriptional regulator|nr:TetR/AcrR family transcriptional regulator [Steroidobacteraceae bacterium]
MARPRSEDKRNAILNAATQVIAVDGVSAPTARIAKIAGVAEGTLFTYFNNKDELLNELYLQLKSELREVMVPDAVTATTKSAKSAAQQAWTRYVSWGVAHPQKRKVLAQLGVSERVTEQSKAAGMVGFTELNAFLSRCVGSKVLRQQPAPFVGSLLGAIAETTMDFISRDPPRLEQYSRAGFEAFWNALGPK